MDKYEKGVVLGRGTFGSVYKAVDNQVPLQSACVAGISAPPGNTVYVRYVPVQTGKVVAIKKIDVGATQEVCTLERPGAEGH